MGGSERGCLGSGGGSSFGAGLDMIVRVVVTTFVEGGVHIDSIYVGAGSKEEGESKEGRGSKGETLSGPNLQPGNFTDELVNRPKYSNPSRFCAHHHFSRRSLRKRTSESFRTRITKAGLDLIQNFLACFNNSRGDPFLRGGPVTQKLFGDHVTRRPS